MPTLKLSDQETKIIFILLLLFTVAYVFLSHEGIYYTDDMTYSNLAVKMMNGDFSITDPSGYTFIHRLTVIVPIAFFYSLFGINLFSYTLWPVLCTLGCLTITYLVSRKELNTAAFAMLFFSLNFYFLYFSNILYPDNIVAFFSLASAAIPYCHQGTTGWRAVIWGILFSLSLFLAFLAKETAVLFLPVFILKFLIDIYHKQNSKFWQWAFIGGLLLNVVYFGWYYSETGDPFYRFTEIERANFLIPNYITQPSRSMVYRLTFEPIHTLLNTGTFPLVVFLVGGSWLSGLRTLTNTSYWTLLGLSGIVALWFASTSYSSYNPINLDGRMYNLLIAPLALAAASGLKHKLMNKNYTAAYTILFILGALVLQNKMSLIYILLSSYFGLHTLFLLRKKLIPTLITVFVLIGIFAIRPVYFALKPKTLYYREHLVMLQFLQQLNKKSTVFIPSYLHHSIPFYYRYKPVTNITYKIHGEAIVSSDEETYLFHNLGITDQPPFSNALPSDSLQELYPQRKLIKEAGPIKLFRLM